MKQRAYEIDVLKGVGILLVILGHCIPDFPVDLRSDPLSGGLERFIYAFHMPLFFFCSGFVLGFAPPSQSFSIFLRNRFLRLMLPWVVFSLLSLGLRTLFSSFTRSTSNFYEDLVNVFLYGKYFWFVYVLFFVMILMGLLKKSKVELILLVILGVYLYSQNIAIFRLNQIGYFTLYTVVGFFISQYRLKLMSMMKNIWIPIILTIMLLLLFFSNPPKLFFTQYFHKIIMAWVGIFALYSMAVHPIRNERVDKMIKHFGFYSLQYYLIHEIISLPCYYIVAQCNVRISIVAVIMNFIIITMLSFIILEVLIKFRWSYKFVGLK